MRNWNLTLGLALLAGTMGCGAAELPTGVLVGKVTQKGEPINAGTVTLLNEETGVGASAELDVSGTYRLAAVRTGDYQVAIQPPPAPSPEEMAAGVKDKPSTIPEQYRDPQTSGLSVSVNSGENTADFEIP